MHSLPSNSAHRFSEVPSVEIPRSRFDRSHGYKTTFDAGYLIPVFRDEALPGDTFSLHMTAFARLATPITPIMDNLFMDSFFFAVPVRLLWSNWQRFCGERTDPDDDNDYLVPVMESPEVDGYEVGSLHDYLGIPTGVPELEHIALYHRAYNLIWNEWFRDQNLQDSVVVDTGDAASDPDDYVLLRRGKRHDYFTSCLPWPQKGDDVLLPLGDTAPIFGNTGETYIYNNVTPTPTPLRFQAGAANVAGTVAPAGDANLRFSTDSAQIGLSVDLENATAATINALREAFQIQKLYERDARGGSRYIEIIRSHFGVSSPDGRLQRPEYLGGGSSPVILSPIPQTSSTDATTPQGNLSAYGTCSLYGHGFSKSFTEHCIIIGLVSVRADLTYQQGLDRALSRQIRWDYYWPALAHIGEQTVLNKEIYAQGATVVDLDDVPIDDGVFGYQERYAEYRYKPSLITGHFRSTFDESLDIWHLSQEFDALPTLSPEFIVEDPPMARVLAVGSEEEPYPHFLFDSYFDLKCARPMPVYSVPGLIDHF